MSIDNIIAQGVSRAVKELYGVLASCGGLGTGDLSDSVLQVGTGMRSQETGGVAL